MSNYGDSASYPQGAKQPGPDAVSSTTEWWAEASREFCRLLDQHQRPPRQPQTSPERIAAARQDAFLYVNTLADWVQAGFMPIHTAEREIGILFAQLADTFGLNAPEFEVARSAAWTDANRAAMTRLDAIAKVVRRLAWEDTTLAQIILAATREADRVHASFGNSQLHDLVVRICLPIAAVLERRERRP